MIGLTWFPLFTMIEWDYRSSTKPIDQHLLDLGLVDARFVEGNFARHNTPLYIVSCARARQDACHFAVAPLDKSLFA